jgi:UDP-N-acetylmuramoyl-tripeptide--D-alanyl-D-alanine ligase
MIYFLIILSILWFIRTLKIVLFYLYLWQIKEYHIKRFIDHFRTSKGASLVFNVLNIIKIFLFSSLILLFYLLPFIYLFETFKAFLDIYKRRLRKPVITRKTLLLIITTISLEVLFILILFLKIELKVWFPVYFLIADLLTPLIVSLIVFVFQPLTYIVRKRLILEACKKREQFPKLTVIGITGSYGKSSTKEFLYEILSEKFKVLKTKKNINAEIGIARTILKELNSEHQIFIAEVGAYERGKIKEVSKMIKHKIAILTGINEQHMATFGSQENIIKAKNEIIDYLAKGGTAIRKEDLDLKVTNPKLEKEYLLFKISNVDFKINVLGKHNLDNILLAVSCAQKLGMSLEEISTACRKIKPEQGGLRFLKRENPVILDSSYSANPNGVIADLDYLKKYSGKKIIVMPCLIELGRASRQVHQRIGKKIAQVCDLAIITTKDHFKEIKQAGANAFFLENPEEILYKLRSEKPKAILLEGRIPNFITKNLVP